MVTAYAFVLCLHKLTDSSADTPPRTYIQHRNVLHAQQLGFSGTSAHVIPTRSRACSLSHTFYPYLPKRCEMSGHVIRTSSEGFHSAVTNCRVSSLGERGEQRGNGIAFRCTRSYACAIRFAHQVACYESRFFEGAD